MRILHIGDFHYRSNKNVYDQKNIIKKLIEKLSMTEKVDFVFFSGDLVFNGERSKDFQEANEILFQPLISTLRVDDENIFICCGNHDINRSECSEAIIDFFSNPDSKIKSNTQLDTWTMKDKKDYALSTQSNKNYYHYANQNHNINSIEYNEFYTIQKRQYAGKSIGIISINSAWLSSGFYEDKGHLLFPIEKLKTAITHLADCSLKILMLHHPLNYLKEFNYLEIQDLIHREFNIMLNGHVHKEQIVTNFNSRNGIYCNTTQATLCFGEKGEIGYSILNIDLQRLEEIKLERAMYLEKENSFLDLEPVIITIPFGEEKYKQNKLRNKIINKFEFELEIANQLLLNYDGQNKRAFLDTYTNPIISTRSEADSNSGTPEFKFDPEQLLEYEKSYIIFGKDKCGKTSLLKHLLLFYIKNYSLLGIIPFYLDYKEFENVDLEKFDIKKEIAKYYELNLTDTNELMNHGRLILLIDNFSVSSPIHSGIINFLEKTENAKFVICSEYIASRIFLEDIDDLEYDKLYFKNLSRTQIRLYTQKQANVKHEKEEVIIEKITNFCNQLQLPVNFWTVSLILLIYKKNNDDYSKNLFSVLDACVDEILNKKRFVLEKSDLKFEQYKILCSQLAYELLVNYRECDYSAEFSEIISFLDLCVKKNPRIVSDPKDIFEYLFNVGILKRKGDKYTFRLNGIFEYFLAFYIKDHPQFKTEILTNDSIYLAFKNELELYSGFKRDDSDFLKAVLKKTKIKFDPIIAKFNKNNTVDENLMRKISDANDFAKNVKQLLVETPLEDELKDKILDDQNPLSTNAEVHVKEMVDISSINFELLEKYLSILSRVFKNLDSIEDIHLINEVFDYILDCYCNLGFHFIEEYEQLAKNENLLATDENNSDIIIGEELLKMISRIIPILMESMFFEGVGDLNLKKIIENKIYKLKMDLGQNQYKLFLLYFLYIDLDLNSHKGKIDEVFAVINLPPLKVATLFKLNFYLAFKAYKIPRLEAFLKMKIQEIQLKLDNKADANNLQKFLADKQKHNLVRKQQMK